LSSSDRRALAYHPVQVNPRPTKTEADVMEILSWRGDGLPPLSEPQAARSPSS
jgi:hypothetical protein